MELGSQLDLRIRLRGVEWARRDEERGPTSRESGGGETARRVQHFDRRSLRLQRERAGARGSNLSRGRVKRRVVARLAARLLPKRINRRETYCRVAFSRRTAVWSLGD